MHDAFLQALLDRPRDDVSRLVYADWLEDQNDPTAALQAEYLRLTVEAARGPLPVEKDARLRQLAADLEPDWLAVVSRIPVENCPREPALAAASLLRFVCGLNWQDLRPTEQRTVRHCPECGKDVHYCGTIREARDHAREDHCIAVDLGILRREADVWLPRAAEGEQDFLLGMSVPDWEDELEAAVTLDPTSAAREQRRYNQHRPESDFDLSHDEEDLADLARWETSLGVLPIEQIPLPKGEAVSRFTENSLQIVTCRWTWLGVCVEVAEWSNRNPNASVLWSAWVPRWFVPRELRTWAALQTVLASAPATVPDPPYRLPDGTYLDPLRSVMRRTHQTRRYDLRQLTIWTWPPPPPKPVLRLFRAYERLVDVARWFLWLNGTASVRERA